MEIELRHLRYFAVLVEEMNFGRAAARLHIAQPSLSQQIHKLEAIIGAELFDRSGRSISLTRAGETLAGFTKLTLGDVEAAVTATRDAARGITGRLSVGFVETAAISIVPGAARGFRSARPRVALELRELPVRAQVEQLVRGSLDLGFVRTEPGHEELVIERAIEEDFVAALPAGHPLAGKGTLDLSQVVNEPQLVIDRETNPGLYDETTALVREHGGSMTIAQQATSILSILGLVSAGLGIALLPASVRDLAFSAVEYVSLEASPRTAILAVRHRDNHQPQIEMFLEAIRD